MGKREAKPPIPAATTPSGPAPLTLQDRVVIFLAQWSYVVLIPVCTGAGWWYWNGANDSSQFAVGAVFGSALVGKYVGAALGQRGRLVLLIAVFCTTVLLCHYSGITLNSMLEAVGLYTPPMPTPRTYRPKIVLTDEL